jgi:hypothetical protein
MFLRAFGLVLLMLLPTACKSPSSMTAQATQCSSFDTTIVPSVYSKAGSTTVWCATCKDKLYYCVSNAARDRVVCKEATEESHCR